VALETVFSRAGAAVAACQLDWRRLDNPAPPPQNRREMSEASGSEDATDMFDLEKVTSGCYVPQ
jgi:hypothetical protein